MLYFLSSCLREYEVCLSICIEDETYHQRAGREAIYTDSSFPSVPSLETFAATQLILVLCDPNLVKETDR